MAIRVNIGCGQSPTPGWSNYDNSPAIRIGQSRLVTGALKFVGLLNAGNLSTSTIAAATTSHTRTR
jgi:hypothetical protein